jgi:hypothetical protein
VFERSELFLRPLKASTADAPPKGSLLWAMAQSAQSAAKEQAVERLQLSANQQKKEPQLRLFVFS